MMASSVPSAATKPIGDKDIPGYDFKALGLRGQVLFAAWLHATVAEGCVH